MHFFPVEIPRGHCVLTKNTVKYYYYYSKRIELQNPYEHLLY